MLFKLIRPLLENGSNILKLYSSQTMSTSSRLFQQAFSGTNSDASAKTNDKTPNWKNKEKNQQKTNVKRAESDNEQERSQQEGPADQEAERKSSNINSKSNK